MRRILIALALALAVVAGLLWLRRGASDPASVGTEPSEPAHAEIDDASRAALERILEQADEEERREEAAPKDGAPR